MLGHFSRLGCMLLASALAGVAWAQQAVPRQEPATTVRKEAALVLVDVLVTDKSGKRVSGLTREEFAVKEEGKPQDIAVFEWKAGSTPAKAPAPLPAHFYTNRPEYHPPREPLTIVLLDSLNTPRRDQALMRKEMIRYLTSSLRSDQWTALLALTDRLVMLQDFTTDSDRLLAAARNFDTSQSALLGVREMVLSRAQEDEIEVLRQGIKSNCGSQDACKPLYEYLNELARFQQDAAAATDKDRTQRTLSAFHALANALRGYPGRKSLIWVSAAFPLFYRASRQESSVDTDLRQTVRLLNDARIAVYPVDPRGLTDTINPETPEQLAARLASQRPQQTPGNPQPVIPSASATEPGYYLATTQGAMKELAALTGGQAFYNRNDISKAVALAIVDGSSYYTLGYYPKNIKWDGKFRPIEVKLARKDFHLRYRNGYYAVPASRPVASSNGTTGQISDELLAALHDPFATTGIVFSAFVPPAEPPAPVRVEFRLDKSSFARDASEPQPKPLDLNFVVAAFSAEGKLLKNVAKRVNWTLDAITYNEIMQRGVVLPTSLELSPGTYQLRLLVRDNSTGLLGRVDVPLTVPGPASPPMR